MNAGIVTNIGKMQGNRFFDVDFLAGNAKRSHQLPGIVIGAVRGTEAGHGHAVHVRGGPSQLAHGLHRHQQRQCRVKAPGNADDCVGISDNRQPLLQSGHLHLEDFHASLNTVLPL